MTLILTEKQLSEIESHCSGAYPEEGCGALIGAINGDDHHVTEVVCLANAGETRADWFEIDPLELVRVERRARDQAAAVVGYFHSHPNSPCRPSRRDLERAWPIYSYLIVTVSDGAASDRASWTLSGSRESFDQEPIQITKEY